MRLLDLGRRAGRSLWSAKTRTTLTAFAIAVGTFALTLTLGASNGVQTYAKNLISDNFDPSELIVTADSGVLDRTDATKPQVYNPNYGSLTTAFGGAQQVRMLSQTDLDRLGGIKGVASVRPDISLSLKYLTRDGQKKYVATMRPYNDYQKSPVLAGSIPAELPAKTLILPQGFLAPLGFGSAQQAIGQRVRLASKPQIDLSTLTGGSATASAQDLPGLAAQLSAGDSTIQEETFTIAAVTGQTSSLTQQDGSGLTLRASRQEVTRLNDAATQGTASYHKYLTGHVKVDGGTDAAKLQQVESAIKKAGYGAQSVKDTEQQLTQIINVLQGIVLVFGLIAVVASVFGVVNTMYISVLQRTREIGLMKALGMHKRDVTRLFRIEAALLGLLGGLLGSAAAILLGTVLNPLISRKLGLDGQHLLDFKAIQILALIAGLVVVATLAGLLPARKAARLDPIEALRTE